MLSQQGSVVFNYPVMPVAIRPIKESKKVFDCSTEYFFKPSDKSPNGWEIMNDEETKVFEKTNFAVGYCGNEIALSVWCSKNCRRLDNLNFMQERSIEEKRQYLWDLVNFNFDEINRIEDRKERSKQLREKGYFFLKYYQSIAETSRTQTVNLWYLSGHDLPTAELLKRFIEYLASK